ncbi:MAG: ComEC/Rec2 family competence protein [bacterium]
MKGGFFNTIKNSKSKMFLIFCFCFVLGVALASGFDLPREWLFTLYITTLLTIFLIIIFRRLGLYLVLFFVFGMVRVLVSQPVVDQDHISFYNGQSVEFVGQVATEPDVRSGYVNYVVQVDGNRKGKVSVKEKLYPRYDYGDHLQIKCKLKKPENFDEKFKYDKYLARYGIYSVCYYPVIVRSVAIKQPCFYYDDEIGSLTLAMTEKITLAMKNILKFKFKVAERIDQLWPEPQASFMAGLLYGSRSGLPEELTENFNRSGITHIIAISGYNISIIVIFVMAILIRTGLYRQQAFWATLVIIFLFVVFTGASASVTRAAIMGSLVLLSQYWGRSSRIGNVMMLALVVMLLINPYVLLWDAGFQLSFLATLGLVYLSPVIARSVAMKQTRQNCKIRDCFAYARNDILVPTLSAIIATLPLILYQFGRLSIVAPLVNILILWIIPWLMLFGFMAVILSFFFNPLGQLIAWLVGFGLDYVMLTANWFGQQDWSSVEFCIPAWMVFWLYLVLFLWVQYTKRS